MLNSDLSSLLWSTYNGGSNDDAGYSVQLNNQNQPLITGGTMSNDFFTTNTAANPTYLSLIHI